jgi:hypothetical protein
MDEEVKGEVEESEEESNARSEATFRFTVDNISHLREQVLSPPTLVRNLPWRIMIMPRSEQNSARNMSLGFFLQCNLLINGLNCYRKQTWWFFPFFLLIYR